MEDKLLLPLGAHNPAALPALWACDGLLARHGHRLTPAHAEGMDRAREASLVAFGRVEFGEGVLPRLLYAFCDSPFLPGDALFEAAPELLEIFYAYKNDTGEQVDDDTLLETMAKAFNGSCHGSLELLRGREMEQWCWKVLGLSYSGLWDEADDEDGDDDETEE